MMALAGKPQIRARVLPEPGQRGLQCLPIAISAFLLIAGCGKPVEIPSASGIEFFQGSYSEALQKAAAEEKLVFVDVYTDWCGPCKLMDLNVFTDPQVGGYFNQHFVCIKRDQEAEVFDGPELTGPNEVKELPTYLFIGADGAHAHKGTGYFEPAAFIRLGEAAIHGFVDNFSALRVRYEAGERDRQFVRSYLLEAESRPLMGARTREGWLFRHGLRQAYEDYLEGTDTYELINAEDFSLLARYLAKAQWHDPLVQFVARNYDAFVAVAPESRVAFLLLESIKHSVGETARKGDASYTRYIDELDGTLAPAYQVQLDVIQNDYLFKEYLHKLGAMSLEPTQQDWAAVHERLERELAAKGDGVTAMDYLSAANLFRDCPEDAWRRRALEFARRAFEMEPGVNTGLTYMALLKDLGDYEAMARVGNGILKDTDTQGVHPDLLYFVESMLLEAEFGTRAVS